MTYPSGLTAVSIGKETAYAVPVTPTYSVPAQVQPADAHTPQADTSWRGAPASVFGHAGGIIDGALQLGGAVYADTIGFPLVGVLGDLVTTNGTPNTHAAALLCSGNQQAASYTVYSADAHSCLQWAGCKFSSVTLTSSGDGVLAWSGVLQGLPGAIVTAPAPNYTAVPMFAGWRGVVQIGGVADAHVLSTSTSIQRPVLAQRNIDGGQTAYGQRSEEVSVTGSLALAMSSDTYRQQYLATTASSLDITYSQGAGAGLQQVKLHCSNITWTTAVRSYGSRWIELDLAWEAAANTADVGASGGRSPIKATLRNTVAAGVYA